jgi:hypothetical protein
MVIGDVLRENANCSGAVSVLSELIGVGTEDAEDRTACLGVGTGGVLKLKVNGSCCRLTAVVLCSEVATLSEVAAPSSVERTTLVLKPWCGRVSGRGVSHADDDDALSDWALLCSLLSIVVSSATAVSSTRTNEGFFIVDTSHTGLFCLSSVDKFSTCGALAISVTGKRRLDALLPGVSSFARLLASSTFCHVREKKSREPREAVGVGAGTGGVTGLATSALSFAGLADARASGMLIELAVVKARRNSLAKSCTLL